MFSVRHQGSTFLRRVPALQSSVRMARNSARGIAREDEIDFERADAPAVSSSSSGGASVKIDTKSVPDIVARSKNEVSMHAEAPLAYQWISNNLEERYQQQDADMYRGKTALELKELDDKFSIFRKDRTVVDLGCFPGGWSQLAVDRCFVGETSSRVFGVDKVFTDPLPGAEFIKGDISLDTTIMETLEKLGGPKADIVLYDVVPIMIGTPVKDRLGVMEMALHGSKFFEKILALRGTLIMRIYNGNDIPKYKVYLRSRFERVISFKPSTGDPAWSYFVCSKFVGREAMESEVWTKGTWSWREGIEMRPFGQNRTKEQPTNEYY